MPLGVRLWPRTGPFVYVCGPLMNAPWPPNVRPEAVRGCISGPGDMLAVWEHTQMYISHSRLEFVGVGPAIL